MSNPWRVPLTALNAADLTASRLLRTVCANTVLAGANLYRTDLTATFFFRTDLRRARVHAARLDCTDFAEVRIEGADAVDAVQALNAVGAHVSGFSPTRRPGEGR